MTRILEYHEAKEKENGRKNGLMNHIKYHREINKIKLKKCLKELALFQVFGDLVKKFQQSDKDRNQVAMGCTENEIL